MTEIKEQLIKQAKDQYKEVYPVSNRQNLIDCFTIHNDKLFFWFNDESFTTRVLTFDLNFN